MACKNAKLRQIFLEFFFVVILKSFFGRRGQGLGHSIVSLSYIQVSDALVTLFIWTFIIPNYSTHLKKTQLLVDFHEKE